MTPELLTLAALALIAIGAASWVSYDRGIQRGRDEQWADDFIAAGQRERARRNKLGQFKATR